MVLLLLTVKATIVIISTAPAAPGFELEVGPSARAAEARP